MRIYEFIDYTPNRELAEREAQANRAQYRRQARSLHLQDHAWFANRANLSHDEALDVLRNPFSWRRA